MQSEVRALINASARPYLRAGLYPYFFAQGKLGMDPIFMAMLRNASIPHRARILDLGCGQSMLASLLIAARRQYQAGIWPRGWPEPPVPSQLMGIEMNAHRVNWARTALGPASQLKAHIPQKSNSNRRFMRGDNAKASV